MNKYFKIIIISLIIFFSVGSRLWNLTTKPSLVVDEPANLRDVSIFINEGKFHPINFHWDFSKPTISYLPTYVLIRYFQAEQVFALRIVSVISSLVALIPFYFLVKKRTSEPVALASTFLFSMSYYYLQFSRVGWVDVVSAVACGLFMFWFLESWMEKLSYKHLLAGSLSASFLFHLYRGGFVYLIVGFIYLIIVFFTNNNKRKILVQIIIFLLIFIVLCLPWIKKIHNNKDQYNLRARVVDIRNVEKPYHGLTNEVDIYKYQIKKTVTTWILINNSNPEDIEGPRYLPLGHKPINSFVAILFWFGLVIGTIRFKQNYHILLIIFLGLVFGQIMTVNPPNGARALIILPFIYLLSSLALNELTKLIKYKYLNELLIVVAIIVGIFDFFFYQNWMSWIQL